MSRILAIVGVLALIGAVAIALASRPPRDVGETLSAPSGVPTTPTPTAPSTTPAPSPSSPDPTPPTASDPSPEIEARPGRLADLAHAVAATPARLAIPALGVDAPVGPVGVEADGQMTVPTDVREVGWYRYGPVPGAAGSAVLAGHVDSRTQGLGVFFELDRLQPGDEVEVTDADGATTTWVVTGRQLIEKAELPLEEVFRRDGPPRLVLVTCGGNFDGDRRSYRSNVVVTAEPRP